VYKTRDDNQVNIASTVPMALEFWQVVAKSYSGLANLIEVNLCGKFSSKPSNLAEKWSHGVLAAHFNGFLQSYVCDIRMI
jgi:hypothetical protein